jgi:hypothetical protein
MNRRTRLLTHDGRTEPLNYWANKIGISKEALMQRLIGGWTVVEAVTTPRYSRPGKRIRRQLARTISDGATPREQIASVGSPRLDERKEMHLALRREVTRTLRQFCRDLDAIMTRGVHPDLLKTRFDRSIPVARDLPKIGIS